MFNSLPYTKREGLFAQAQAWILNAVFNSIGFSLKTCLEQGKTDEIFILNVSSLSPLVVVVDGVWWLLLVHSGIENKNCIYNSFSS